MTPKPNLQKLFSAHLTYETHARGWAEKAGKLQAAGKPKEAEEARQKAKRWLSRALEIELKLKA